jgi:GH24 family phage-related lysozyme (muramidase)
MKTSANGINFIKAREGYTPIAKDDNGHLMWGHGHDRRGFESVPDFISLADADALLASDLAVYFDPVVSNLAPWASQNQHDALADFAYNLGVTALATMLHHGQAQVVAQIPSWCYEHVNGILQKSPGLSDRRQKEIVLYGS